jgi:hypothetical protein
LCWIAALFTLAVRISSIHFQEILQSNLQPMIASSFPWCVTSLPRAASRPSSLPSRFVSPLRFRLNNRDLHTCRPLPSLPLSEREIIHRLEKSLRRTQRLGLFCLSVTTGTLTVLSLQVQAVTNSSEELNRGFESAGRTLVEGFHGLK